MLYIYIHIQFGQNMVLSRHWDSLGAEWGHLRAQVYDNEHHNFPVIDVITTMFFLNEVVEIYWRYRSVFPRLLFHFGSRLNKLCSNSNLPQAVKVQQRFGAQQRAPLSVFLSKSGNCGFLIWPFFVSRPLPRIVLIFTTSSGRPYLGRSSPGGCYLGTIGEFFLSASRHAPSKILERTLQLLTITDTPVKMEVWKMFFLF